MGGESCSEGCGFESQHCILDGHFSHIFVVKIVMFVWKDENKLKRGRGWPFFNSFSQIENLKLTLPIYSSVQESSAASSWCSWSSSLPSTSSPTSGSGHRWSCVFFKKWAKTGLDLFIFRSLQMSNSIDGVLGIRTQGGRMVGEDESIELWRQPSCVFSVIHCNTISTYRISSANKVAIFNNYRAILDISLK